MCKKWFLIPLLILVVTAVVFVGCAAPATAPSPSPKPAPSPATTPTPAQKQVAINILGATFGVVGYIACFTLADLITKYSPWLRATNFEQKGNSILDLEAQPEKKKNTIYVGPTGMIGDARQGNPPYKSKVNSVKSISIYFLSIPGFITMNPDIKTAKDFVGKKIAIPGPPSGAYDVAAKAILGNGIGLDYSKLNIQFLDIGGCMDALADGKVDIAYFAATVLSPTQVVPSAGLQQFLSTIKRDVYWIDIPADVMVKATEGSGTFYGSMLVPAAGFGPKQPKAFNSWTGGGGWAADDVMDPAITYEVTRIIYEYHQEFWAAHTALKYLTPETMATVMPKETDYHAGVIKFYKEKGIKIGK